MDALTNWPDKIDRGTPQYNNVISVTIVNDVETEPVTVAVAKAYCKIDFSDDDAIFTDIVKEAREELEGELNLSLASKRIKVELRNELGYMKLPYGPVISIDSVKDVDGNTLDANRYVIKNGILETSFPTTVFVQYVTGYTTLPAKYKRMIKERVAANYVNRGDKGKVNQNKVWLI